MDNSFTTCHRLGFCRRCSYSIPNRSYYKSRSRSLDRLKGSKAVDFAQVTHIPLPGEREYIVKCPVCCSNIVVTTDREVYPFIMERLNNIPRLKLTTENGFLSTCQSCDGCDAEVSCIECDRKMCFDCVRIHLRSPSTRRHHVTGITENDDTPQHSHRRSRSPSPVRSSPARRTSPPHNRNISPVQNGRRHSPHRRSLSPRRKSPSPRRSTNSPVPFTNYADSGVEDSLSPISPFESYSFAPISKSLNSPLTRANQILQEELDLYQRGNSPRPNERKQFDFKPTVTSNNRWKNSFTQMTTFELPSYVLSMCAGPRDQCWIAEAMSSAIHLYNADGQHVRSVELYHEVRDIVVNKATDEVFVSCFASKQIKVVNSVGEVNTFASCSLHPAGVSVNSYGDVIVCAVEDLRRRYKPDHKNCLLVFSKEGRLKREIDRDVTGKIFAYPEYITVNINGDIIVSDIEKECVVILSAEAKVKCIYKGPAKGTLDKPFDPRDVKCDKDGNIVVCDINNNALHLLDINGKYQRLLISEEDGIYWPDVVAIDNRGHIWVRELWQHTVKIYQNV